MNLIVAYIHNNVLMNCIACADQDHALDLVKEQFTSIIGRDMTDTEVEEFLRDNAVYNDEDSDNLRSWSLGIVENRG